VETAEFVEAASLTTSNRADGGFGSTGGVSGPQAPQPADEQQGV